MDEDGLELQPQEPNSYFDAAGITTGVVPLPTYQIWSWLSSGKIARRCH